MALFVGRKAAQLGVTGTQSADTLHRQAKVLVICCDAMPGLLLRSRWPYKSYQLSTRGWGAPDKVNRFWPCPGGVHANPRVAYKPVKAC